jgi:3-deoxy-manno-octulosonate cytidylyltransferase (CMP-KDO synthetase)
MKIVCVIPARLQSTRLPQKPLLDICGKTMLQRTYERACAVFPVQDVYIATESEKIKDIASCFTKNVVLTSEHCLTGTDRLANFAEIIRADVYVNLQGDEPIMPIENILIIRDTIQKYPKKVINGYAPINNKNDYLSPMIPKVCVKSNHELLYMSRSPIPGNKEQQFVKSNKQICVYAFPRNTLQYYGVGTNKATIEDIEDIEILRLVEANVPIQMVRMNAATIAVDIPEDLQRVRDVIQTQGEGLPVYDCG